MTSNQTFMVTPDELSLAGTDTTAAEDTDITYTVAGLDDVDDVVIAAVDADDVTVTDGEVSFAGDDAATLNNTPTNVELSSVAIDGTTFTGVSFGDEFDVAGVSSVSFVVASSAVVAGQTVPVVYVADTNGDLAIDADGLPEAGFGIGGQAYFVNPTLADVDPAAATVTADGEASVTLQVQEDAVPTGDLEVAGIELQVRVSASDVGDFDGVPVGDNLLTSTVTTDADGAATFSFDAAQLGLTGLDDPGDSVAVYVYAKWTGAGSLDGLSDSTEQTTHTVTFQVPDVADSVEVDAAEYLGVGMTQTVEFQIVDGATPALPVAAEGLTVTYQVSRDDGTNPPTTFSRTAVTDATGLATDSFTKAGDAAIDTITVTSVTDADGDEVTKDGVATSITDGVAPVTSGWFVQAASDAALATAANEVILAAETDALNVLLLADETLATTPADFSTMVWVDYTDAALYQLDGAAVTFAAWEDAVINEAASDVTFGDSEFEAANRDDANIATIYNIVTSPI